MKLKTVLETIYGGRERVTTCHGERYKSVYTPALDEENRISLIEAGKDDLYAYIQSHKDSVDINTILSRYAAGDVSALHKGDMMYLDVTNMPKTYAEMYERVMQAQEMFDHLPLEVRERFDHNPAQFFASIGTPEFADIVGDVQFKDPEPEVTAPTTPAETVPATE